MEPERKKYLTRLARMRVEFATLSVAAANLQRAVDSMYRELYADEAEKINSELQPDPMQGSGVIDG